MGKGFGIGVTAAEVRRKAQRQIRRVGVSGAQFLRTGMRRESLAYARKPYAGKTPAEAQRIATTLTIPVLVGVHPGGRIELIDGRHRAQAAREAGARSIKARVRVYGRRGALRKEYVARVKL
jgi:hypothetical protein